MPGPGQGDFFAAQAEPFRAWARSPPGDWAFRVDTGLSAPGGAVNQHDDPYWEKLIASGADRARRR